MVLVKPSSNTVFKGIQHMSVKSFFETVFFQLLDEMGKELEELRRYKREHEGKSPRGSISELPGRYRDLQNEIQKLREVSDFLFLFLQVFF